MMCPPYIAAVCAAMALFVHPMHAAAPDPELERAARQTVAFLQDHSPVSDPRWAIPGASEDETVETYLRGLNSEGFWPDIRYDDKTRGAWSPSFHLKRVLEMARAYTTPGRSLCGDARLGNGIHRAFNAWLDNDYECPNWWHNQIGVPLNTVSIMLMIQKELTPREREIGLKIASRAKIGMTGQNRVWVSGITLWRGLLENDAALVQLASDTIAKEIVITQKEGLQPDFSFHQHGPQLQFGNYGLGFANDIGKFAKTLQGTRFAFKEDRIAILRSYVLEGQARVVWKDRMDISSCGRQLFPSSPRQKASSLLFLLDTMKQTDPSRAAEYDKAIGNITGKQVIPGNKLFWRSDYMVDRRPTYFASVKMNSPRVVGSELVNEENVSGYHSGDGALYVYQTGREYEDIFPVWNWRKLPGVTCIQRDDPIAPFKNVPEARNQHPFVGGVSDGQNGASVLTYQRDGVTAKKSVFFLDGQIVCLGAGIASQEDAPLATGVAQCLLKGPVTLGAADGHPVPAEGRKEYSNLRWAHHDGTGYVFPQPARITAGGAPQTGTWKNVYKAGPGESITKDVFAVWIDHGSKPKNAAYEYIILPGATATKAESFALASMGAEILSNTQELQAVKFGEIVIAIFHQPGILGYKPGQSVSVDAPCALMLTRSGSKPKLTVADPSQKLAELHVQFGGKTATVRLPSGGEAGSSTPVPVGD